MTDGIEVTDKPKRRWNWWKIGFFITLFAFECAREWAVIASDSQASPAVSAYVGETGGFVSATGRWRLMTDPISEGDQIQTNATTIQCWQDKGQCIEATAHISNGYVTGPTVDWFDATFTPDGVSYENDAPECAKYSVRIDFKLEKVFALRERKPNPTNEICKKLTPRVEMTLKDGYQKDDYVVDKHFVPVLQGVIGFFKLF